MSARLLGHGHSEAATQPDGPANIPTGDGAEWHRNSFFRSGVGLKVFNGSGRTLVFLDSICDQGSRLYGHGIEPKTTKGGIHKAHKRFTGSE